MPALLPAADPQPILTTTAHRPYPLPSRPWRLAQRWNDLLFAHWPIPAAMLAPLLPSGLEVDTFDGSAWVGVIPFWMDHVRTRSFGSRTFGVPSTRTFNELNLRTYVRSRVSGLRGVFFFSLDCDSPLAVLGARTLFHLPYFPAEISRTAARDLAARDLAAGEMLEYRSRRQLTRDPAGYDATYGPIPGSPLLPQSQPGDLAHFLTERYCLFTPSFGRMLVGHIHHLPWALQPAHAEIRLNQVPAARGIILPATPPVLHFSRSLDVFLWSLQPDRP